MGRIRAKQDRIGDRDRRKGMAILIHGDAAFAGEGVVQESLNLSQLPAYLRAARSTSSSTTNSGSPPARTKAAQPPTPADVAKMLPVPIFHVNGEYPQSVAQVVELAMDFRTAFQRDVFIDMYSFRRWGHNEADEPSFTQPLVYKAIEHRPSTRDSYLKHLLQLGKVTEEEATRLPTQNAPISKNNSTRPRIRRRRTANSRRCLDPYVGGSESDDGPDTGVPIEQLKTLLEKHAEVPDGFHLHKKLQRTVERRQKMAKGEEPLDWSAAEALAFASLAIEGHPVRLSGQDSERGTFSQRHAVLHDVVDGREYAIFEHLANDQARVDIINSPLCETGTMGFEYGYSLDYPEGLILWEAQYGDFVNAAQVIIDQFISSAEDKWRRLSGLVLLLPHAFEGKGPEHSSARLERFLFLAAEDNLQVVTPSTPGPILSLPPPPSETQLAKAAHRAHAKKLTTASAGHFETRRTSNRPHAAHPRRQTRESIENNPRAAQHRQNVLRPRRSPREAGFQQRRDNLHRPILPASQRSLFPKHCSDYAPETPVRWVQEEPENMGAWPFWKNRFCHRLVDRFPFSVVARSASASPATGSSAAHHREHEELIARAFKAPS